MSSFKEFHKSLLELTKSFEEKKTQLKVESDLESDIIKIFGEKFRAAAFAFRETQLGGALSTTPISTA